MMKFITNLFMTTKAEKIKQKLDLKSAELVHTMLVNRGCDPLSGKKNSQQEGFEHVFRLEPGDGTTVIMIASSRVAISNCGFQLEFDDEENMQFSKSWLDKILSELPESSEAKQAINSADKLITAVAGMDTETGKFEIIPVDASST
jgi:hypothetical protein